MKFNKNLSHTLLGAMVLGVLAVGCKDDFSEEDLLNSQVELAEQQDIDKAARAAEALNAAGDLLSYAVTVVSNGNQPVAGASVTLVAGGATEGQVDNQTLTTDANGQVVFGRVVIGGNILKISADGFLDITASVDFGTIDEGEHYQLIDGQIVPTPVTESSIIPLFSTAQENTATISGVATIETDLTNTTPEVPQDLTLQANLSNFANTFSTGGSITPFIYVFDNDQTIGTAQVDNATGAYSMQVPTTPDGIFVSLLVPDISAEQTLAITERNGFELPRPEYAQVPTNYGPDWGSDFDIPFVPGAIWVFDEPQAAGAGFNFTFERLGRSMTTGTFTMASMSTPLELNNQDIVAHANSAGSGYVASPTVTITDENGKGAVAVAHMEIVIDELTVIQAGDNAANTSVDLDFYYDEITATYNPLTDQIDLTIIENVADDLFDIDLDVTTDNNGDITQEAVNAELAAKLAAFNPDEGFDADDPYQIAKWITNPRLTEVADINDPTNPVIYITGTSMQVYQIAILEAGRGYTNPTFTFSGGDAFIDPQLNDMDNPTLITGYNDPLLTVNSVQHANIEIDQFGTRWVVTPDNLGNTIDYTTLPEDVSFEYVEVDDGSQFVATSSTVADKDGFNPESLIDLLEVVDGQIQFQDQIIDFYATQIRAHEMPKALIEEPVSVAPNVNINSISVDENGGITSYNTFYLELGEGYTAPFGATVEPAAIGAPGSGAEVELTGGQIGVNGEYDWFGGFDILSTGSGYLENLNQQSAQSYDGYFNQTIKSGQEYLLNIQYGTGVRQEEVD